MFWEGNRHDALRWAAPGSPVLSLYGPAMSSPSDDTIATAKGVEIHASITPH